MKLRSFIIFLLVVGMIFLAYKFLVVRTVYYEIGGIKIPSRYNMITGTVRPISNYRGKAKLGTVEASKTNKLGLTDEEVAIARL